MIAAFRALGAPPKLLLLNGRFWHLMPEPSNFFISILFFKSEAEDTSYNKDPSKAKETSTGKRR